MEVDRELSDIIAPIREKQNNCKKPAMHKKFQVCDIFETHPHVSDAEAEVATSYVDDIIREAIADPVKWGDLRQATPEVFTPPGKGTGNQKALIKIVEPLIPGWMKELGESIKVMFKRRKTRRDLETDTLDWKVGYKDKGKHNVRHNTVYCLLDTSGSMWGATVKYKNKPVIEYMVSFFPAIAKKYTGEVLEIDTEVKNRLNFKDITKDKMKNFFLSGGGGTNFDEGFKLLLSMKNELKEQGKDSDFTTVVFTDGDVAWPPDSSPLALDHMVIVTLKGAEGRTPATNPAKFRKVILIDTD